MNEHQQKQNPQQQQKTITIPNGQSMKTSKTIKIKINSLPEEAKIGNILPGIKNNPIAAPPLCDAGCELLIRKKTFSSQKTKNYFSEDDVTL